MRAVRELQAGGVLINDSIEMATTKVVCLNL